MIVSGGALVYFWFISPPEYKPLPPPLPKREVPPPPIEKPPPKAKLTIVVDDLGYKLETVKTLARLDAQLTFAVIPNLDYSRQTVQIARKYGQEVLIHLPLEPHNYSRHNLLPQMLLVDMPPDQFKDKLRRLLDSVPQAVGVNNHMGSLITEDPHLMRLILQETKKRGLFFLDSRTSAKSVAYRLAKALGLTAFRRDLFLDNENDPQAVLKQLEKLRDLAERRGHAIGICHPKKATIAALKQFLGQLDRDKFELARLTEPAVTISAKQP